MTELTKSYFSNIFSTFHSLKAFTIFNQHHTESDPNSPNNPSSPTEPDAPPEIQDPVPQQDNVEIPVPTDAPPATPPSTTHVNESPG